jgi:hypothetical protein
VIMAQSSASIQCRKEFRYPQELRGRGLGIIEPIDFPEPCEHETPVPAISGILLPVSNLKTQIWAAAEEEEIWSVVAIPS